MFPARSVFAFVTVAVSVSAAPALGGITVFDSRGAFEAWGAMRGDVQIAVEDFSNVSAGLTAGSVAGKLGTAAEWSATALTGVTTDTGMLRTVEAGKSIALSFATRAVYGIGADFFATNAAGVPISGYVLLRLDDGTQFVRNLGSAGSFAGFWSDTAITGITVMPLSPSMVVGADDMGIGFAAVPGPGAVALLVVAGACATRRRA